MSVATILMLGDSLIDYGNWESLLPEFRVISSGMPGERAEELLSRLHRTPHHEEVDGILVMTGTNNIFTNCHDLPATFETIVDLLQQRYPSTPLLLNSLVPFHISFYQDIIRSTNHALQEVASRTGSIYVDLYTPFAAAEEDLFEYDGVHFSEAGYRVWAHLLATLFARLLAKEAD